MPSLTCCLFRLSVSALVTLLLPVLAGVVHTNDRYVVLRSEEREGRPVSFHVVFCKHHRGCIAINCDSSCFHATHTPLFYACVLRWCDTCMPVGDIRFILPVRVICAFFSVMHGTSYSWLVILYSLWPPVAHSCLCLSPFSCSSASSGCQPTIPPTRLCSSLLTSVQICA